MELFNKKKKQQIKDEQKTMEIVLAEMDNIIRTGKIPTNFDPEVSIATTDIDGVLRIVINALEKGEAKNYDQKFKRPNIEKKVSKWLKSIGYERFEARVFSSIATK